PNPLDLLRLTFDRRPDREVEIGRVAEEPLLNPVPRGVQEIVDISRHDPELLRDLGLRLSFLVEFRPGRSFSLAQRRNYLGNGEIELFPLLRLEKTFPYGDFGEIGAGLPRFQMLFH